MGSSRVWSKLGFASSPAFSLRQLRRYKQKNTGLAPGNTGSNIGHEVPEQNYPSTRAGPPYKGTKSERTNKEFDLPVQK